MSSDAPVTDKSANVKTPKGKTPKVKHPKTANPNREILGTLKRALKGDEEQRKAALVQLETLVSRGDTTAMRVLASTLSKTQKPEEQARAFTLYKTAGDAGDADALFAIALAHRDGRFGQAQDLEKVEKFMKLSADAGHPKAQLIALKKLMPGKGGVGDVGAAWKLYKSGYSKHASSHAMMGAQLESGKHLAQDFERAASLYARGAERGDAAAAFKLYRLYSHPKRKVGTPALAMDALRKAVELGHEEASSTLDQLLESRKRELEADTPAAYEAAARDGDSAAKLWLGRAYAAGSHGVMRDIDRATYWLQSAAEDGLAEARAELDELVSQR